MTYSGLSGLIEFGIDQAYANGYDKGFVNGIAVSAICVLVIIGIILVAGQIRIMIKEKKIEKENIKTAPLQKEATP